MLTTVQKAAILVKVGIDVPAASAPESRWTQAVNALFVEYVAARAAKSLRDSEDARQLAMLRDMATRPLRSNFQPLHAR